jgi:hypothetical protein
MIKVLGGTGGCFCKLKIERNFDESIAKYACVFLVRNEAIGHDPSRGGHLSLSTRLQKLD